MPALAAARWVPSRPLYLFASPSVDSAQGAARDAIELLAVATGVDLREAMRASAALLGVDVLHPEPLAEIGVDLRGSWALFGDDLSPTLVVHLAAPAQMAAFLDRQRARGLITRSVVVDRTEVVSATLPIGAAISWAIDGDWMWVHVAPSGGADRDAGWFVASHAAHDFAWADGWAWARRAAGASASLVGLIDARGRLSPAIARAAGRVPDAVACARLAEQVGRVAIGLGGDARHVSARLSVDVGSTDRLRSMLLAAPAGWDAAASHAAIAAQWNLDLAAARPWLAPCVAAAGGQLALADETGVRAARGLLVGFDPDKLVGTGAIALDLASTGFLESQLDRIPLRRTLERARTFGPYRGHSIAIPFSVTVDYVLDGKLAIAALGDGLLARLVSPPASPVTAPGAAPVLAIDVAPPAMSAHAWEVVLAGILDGRLDGASDAVTRRVVEQLMAWREGHLAVRAEGSEIAFTISGTRR